ncbi:MAG: VIT domain-containing protein [Candidatus Eremiobacteraeota bacterium]|nr:VIT domain-containing protein [Candidatus Eremiobacteraeota bacterium]
MPYRDGSKEYLPLFEPEDFAEARGSGALSAIIAQSRKKVEFPLEKVEYIAHIADGIAWVEVRQSFRNPYDEPVEAVYTFPLAGGAAVNHFELRVGERVITGRARERVHARESYHEALRQGKRAALLEQERDEIFTMQAGNIPPGESVSVWLTYSERLPLYNDGFTEFRLPLVVAPRFIPGAPMGLDPSGRGVASDTDIVPDASRISPLALPAACCPAVKLSIEVLLRHHGNDGSSMTASTLTCSQHAITLSHDDGSVKVWLASTRELMDRDFVLRWRFAGEKLSSAFWCYRDKEKVYGMVTLIPPAEKCFTAAPRDVVFVLDRSGSMEGAKMKSAAKACALLLNTLGPHDRFAIQAFDDRVQWMTRGEALAWKQLFFSATEAGIARGEKYLRGLSARGGTNIFGALRSALDVLERDNLRKSAGVPVIVLITDGAVGDEMQITRYVRSRGEGVRIFAVGVDTAVNKGFLSHLASLGRGTASFVHPGDGLENALRSIAREIGEPVVTGLEARNHDGSLDDLSLAPGKIPDLFAGRASTFFFTMKKEGHIIIKGTCADGREFKELLAPCLEGPPAISHLWARLRLTDLEDRYFQDMQGSTEKEIIRLAMEHNLLSRFTAFVAIDEAEVASHPGDCIQVAQPVAYPAGWAAPSWSPSLSGGSGGGFIMVDLLPTERRKFGFSPVLAILIVLAAAALTVLSLYPALFNAVVLMVLGAVLPVFLLIKLWKWITTQYRLHRARCRGTVALQH